LAPFTYIKDPFLALKIASITVTAVGILLVFFSLKRLGVKWPHFWTILFLVSSPSLFYRLSALRPQLFSFGLSFLFFAYFFRPAINRRKNLAVFFLLSFVSAWIHGALSWVNFVIFGIGSLAEKFTGKKFRFRELLVIVGGTLAGFFLRPHPWPGLKLIYIQLVQNSIEEYKKTPLLWGTELLHFAGKDFMYQFLPVIFLLLIALFFLYRFSGEHFGKKFLGQDFKAQIWTALIVGAFFFWLAFASARRSANVFFDFSHNYLYGWVFSL